MYGPCMSNSQDSTTSSSDFRCISSLWTWIASWHPQAGMLLRYQKWSLLLWHCLEEGWSPVCCAGNHSFFAFSVVFQCSSTKGFCEHLVYFIGMISGHHQGYMLMGLRISYQGTCLWLLPREWSAVTLLASPPLSSLSKIDGSILLSSEESFFQNNSMLTGIHWPDPNSVQLPLC